MTDDGELLKKRFRELALRAFHSGNACYTRFLEPPSERDARSAAAAADVTVAFWGGYEGAERRIAAFYRYEEPEAGEYPLKALTIEWNPKYARPGHRDLLGAVMGLGLERDATGDIAPGAQDGTAYLFAHADVADYICANLESAGRAAVKTKSAEREPRLAEAAGEELRITVNAPRMDAVIAAALKLSRGEAQRLIDGGLVKRNHLEERRGDRSLQCGDLLSVRGYGRLRVIEDLGITRKGRSALRLFRYKG